MCFSPQRRAIFRHLNFKKWSKHAVFCTFSLPDVLFATTACNFSTSELQKVLRDCGVLYIFTSKSAFRHSGVQFLISLLSTDLRTRRFNRLTFRLTRHTNHWKNTAFRDFSNIWRGCIFFLLTFALLHLLSADLTTLLCFSTVHIVGSFYLNFLRLCKQILFVYICIYWLVVNTINIASMTFKTSYSPCIFFWGDRFLLSKGSVPGVLVDVKVRAEMIPCESGAIFRWLQEARLKLGELGLGWSRCIKMSLLMSCFGFLQWSNKCL